MQDSCQGLRVLLVGSQRGSIEPLRKLLLHHGALVSTVESSKKALRVLKNDRMHLLIVDDDSKLDVATFMQAVRLLPNPAINTVAAILLASDLPASNGSYASTAYFQRQMRKPVSFDQLLKAITEISSVRSSPPSVLDVHFRVLGTTGISR